MGKEDDREKIEMIVDEGGEMEGWGGGYWVGEWVGGWGGGQVGIGDSGGVMDCEGMWKRLHQSL